MFLTYLLTGNGVDLVYTATGYIEFSALGTGQLGILVPYTIFGYTIKKNIDINLGYITIEKIELSALIRYRIVGYAISVHTQPLGMLAVIKILCTQTLAALDRYHCLSAQLLGRLAVK